MTINLTNEININSNYLKSSYSNDNYPYIKGKKFESIFGNNRVVQMDSHLNKYYISHLKKQDQILQEKKIIEMIEKLDNKKAFNVIKEDYLKEKSKISKGYYLKKRDKKKDYFTNLINLENYKEKLNQNAKTTNGEGDFLYTLMNCLGCRPKKIVFKRVNKKIELLSKFKSYSQRKKQIEDSKKKKPERRKSLQYLLNYDSSNYYGINNNYLNYFSSSNKKTLPKYSHEITTNFNNANSHGFNNTNYIKKLTFEINDADKYNNTSKNFYNQKLFTNYNIFKINTDYNNENIHNISNKSKKLNLQNDESSIQNSISEYNNYYARTEEKVYDSNYKKLNSLSLSKKKYSKKPTKKDLLSKELKPEINTKTTNSEMNKNKNGENKKKLSINPKFLNISDDDENYEELKMIDLKIMNERLNKKHKKIIKKFLEKIKFAEKDIKESSNKLSRTINLIKKFGQTTKDVSNMQKNKTEINFYKKGFNTDRSENKKNKNQKFKKNEIKIGNCDYIGKSKYRLPKINKFIFGSIENSKDLFEILQSNLLTEVQKQAEKKGLTKRLRLNGRDIIDKLRLKFQY